MGRKSALLRGLDAEILAIGPGSDAAAARVRGLLDVDFPIFADPRLELYAQLGYQRVLAIVRQSGTVVLDRGGKIALLHRTANPLNALPFDDVLSTLERLRASPA